MLLNIEHVSKSYGDRQLLNDVTMYMKAGDRTGVVGVNGCGKSTFLKVAAGAESPDSGSVSTDPNVRISYLSQDPEYVPERTALEQVLGGQREDSAGIETYEAERILGKLGIENPGMKMSELSGGQRKRVFLAQSLAAPADLLILDEPTNHLDIGMIEWLEEYLQRFSGAILFVTHDRYFLEKLASKTAEVSFGRLFIYEGGYSSWLAGKANRETMEAASERKRQATLRRELIWVLQGPCARGTKSRERLERYAALKAQLPPQLDGEIKETMLPASRLGKKTIELSGVSKGFGDGAVVKNFDFLLLRDDRVGIVGMNGSGKTTLLNLIAGKTAPDSGTVSTGDTVKTGYFSQHSEELDGSMTALEYVKEKGDRIETPDGTVSAGKLMEMFLFPAELQQRKIEKLSGGEKRRLFLLGILASAPNVLLLDEPTNDLDIPTLRVLENYLMNFPGAVITVSHDRYFLDRICRRIFVVEKGREARQFNGGVSDCHDMLLCRDEPEAKDKTRVSAPAAARPKPQKLRFSFKEQREFETIDADIAALEAELEKLALQQEGYCSDYVRLQELTEKQGRLEAELEHKMERWEYLNTLAEQIAAQG